jgi:WD40 repeat protein
MMTRMAARPAVRAGLVVMLLAVLAGLLGMQMLGDRHDSRQPVRAGNDGGITHVAFSPDGRTLAVASWDWRSRQGVVRGWDTSTNASRVLLRTEAVITSIAWSPDGSAIATGDYTGTIRLWDVPSGRTRASAQGVQLRPRDEGDPDLLTLAFSPDGERLASATVELLGGPKIWDSAGLGLQKTLPGNMFGNPTLSLAWSPDGRTLAVGDLSSRVKLWDASDGLGVRELEGHARLGIKSLAWSPDGSQVACSGVLTGRRCWPPVGWEIKLWDAGNGRVKTFRAHDNADATVAWSPDGALIASGSTWCDLKLWAVSRKLLGVSVSQRRSLQARCER